MTPEQWTEWEQIVKECKTTSMWKRKLAMIAADAELERLRKVMEAARAHSREARLNHICKVCNAIAEYDKETTG